MRLALAAAVIATGLTLGHTASARASVAPPVPSEYPGPWSPSYINTPITQATEAEAVTVAESNDVVVAQVSVYLPWIAKMKQINPSLQMFAYQNGSFAEPGKSYPQSWYAHNANGARVTSIGWGNYLMSPSSPEWAQTVTQQCTANVALGYDGCFLDSFGDGILATGYLSSLPVDAATGQVWTQPEWVAADVQIAQTLRAAEPSIPIIANTIGNGQRYWSSTRTTLPILNVLGGGMEELFLRTPSAPVSSFKSQASWLQDVTVLSDAESRGDFIVATTKLWVTATVDQINAWHRYALASFLMGTEGHDRFSFLATNTWPSPITPQPYDQVQIGTPVAPMAEVNGAFQRQFTNGLALVNPTTSTVTVALGSSYTDLEGDVVTSLTLPPNTGDVLVSSA
jgi:hypothetical protein